VALVLGVDEDDAQRGRAGPVERDGLEGEAAQVAAVGPHELLGRGGVPECELDPSRLRGRGEEAWLHHLHDAVGLEDPGGHAHVLVGLDAPAQAHEALAVLRVQGLQREPAHAPLAHLERPGGRGWRLHLEQGLAPADNLGHPEIAGEVDLPPAVGREHVARILDPDQVVGPVAPDPLVADRVARPLGPEALGPRGGGDTPQEH